MNTQILRISYIRELNDDPFNLVEDALNRANFNVTLFSIGEYNDEDGIIKGNCDFRINNDKEIDLLFCQEIIESIINFKFEINIYKKEILFK